MIVVSIVLVVVAAGLLVVGLLQRSDLLLFASIVFSALAALALVVGVRYLAAGGDPDQELES